MQRATDRDHVIWPHFVPKLLGGAFDQDEVLPNAGGGPAGRFKHGRLGIDANHLPHIRRKAECDQPRTGAEIDQPVSLGKPSFSATSLKNAGG
jgi:hypothetical protein